MTVCPVSESERDAKGWIFCREFAEGVGKLIFVGFGCGFDRHGDDGFGERHHLKDDGALAAFIAEGIASGCELHANDCCDVARLSFFDVFAFIRVHEHEATDALFAALGCIIDSLAAAQASSVEADEGKLAVLVVEDFKGEGAQGFFVRFVGGDEFDVVGGGEGVAVALVALVGVSFDAANGLNVFGAGQKVDDGIEELLDAFVSKCSAAQDGDEVDLEAGFSKGAADER